MSIARRVRLRVGTRRRLQRQRPSGADETAHETCELSHEASLRSLHARIELSAEPEKIQPPPSHARHVICSRKQSTAPVHSESFPVGAVTVRVRSRLPCQSSPYGSDQLAGVCMCAHQARHGKGKGQTTRRNEAQRKCNGSASRRTFAVCSRNSCCKFQPDRRRTYSAMEPSPAAHTTAAWLCRCRAAISIATICNVTGCNTSPCVARRRKCVLHYVAT